MNLMNQTPPPWYWIPKPDYRPLPEGVLYEAKMANFSADVAAMEAFRQEYRTPTPPQEP